MIFDTDILIYFQRGNIKALDAISNDPNRYISIITYMELAQGIRNKKELKDIKDFIIQSDFTILNLNQTIGTRALIYVEMFALSHTMVLSDALIASTAIENALTLCTSNIKHFKCIKELALNQFKP